MIIYMINDKMGARVMSVKDGRIERHIDELINMPLFYMAVILKAERYLQFVRTFHFLLPISSARFF